MAFFSPVLRCALCRLLSVATNTGTKILGAGTQWNPLTHTHFYLPGTRQFLLEADFRSLIDTLPEAAG